MPLQSSRHRDLEAPPHCAANSHARSGGKQKHEPPASAWRGPVAAALCTSVCPPSGDPVMPSLDSVPGQGDDNLMIISAQGSSCLSSQPIHSEISMGFLLFWGQVNP